MDLLRCEIYLLLIILLGYVSTSLLLAGPRWHWAELIGMSMAGGFGLLGIILFDLSLLGARPSRNVLVSIAVIAGAVLIGLRRRMPKPSWPRPVIWRCDPQILLAAVACVLLIAAISNVAVESLTPGLADIDAYAIWMLKAKIVAAEALRPIPHFLLDPSLSYSHQDYPLGMPLVVAGMYAAIGGVDEQLGKTVLLPIYLALVLVVYSALARRLNRWIAIVVTVVFAAAPVVVQHAGIAEAEVTFVLMHACCLVLLLRWMQEGGWRPLTASAAFAAFAAFTKNEGLALLPVVGLIALGFAVGRHRIREWVIAAAVAVLLIGPWIIYRRHLPHTHEDYGGKLTSIATIVADLPRLRQVLPQYLGYFWEFNSAGVIWPLLLMAAAVGWRAFGQLPVVLLWTLLLVHLGLYLASFVVTPWDLNTLIPMVSPKLLMHAAPAAVLLIGLHISAIRPKVTQELPQSA